MLPATLNLAQYFYPLGNTTPNDLTQTLPPGADANILLLGCGDVRNVLFTLHCSGTSSLSNGQSKIDFTCCDVEPAVIARNVLILFAILEDESESNDPLLWEIYYHMFLSTPASELLQALIKRLLLMTESLDEWHKSVPGSCIRLVNHDTLSQLRGFWTRYPTEPMPEKREMQIVMEEFRRTKCGDFVVTSARSAGPFYIQALETAPILHKNFWEKGVTWGDGEEAIQTNPTMIVTGIRGTKFAVHYGTEPVLPFHLAPAFAELSSSDPLYRAFLGSSSTIEERASRIADIAKSQFSMWSASFRQSALRSTTHPRLRFVISNALSLCSALAERQSMLGSAPTYARQWTFTPMLLDSEDYPQNQQTDRSSGPTSFNVIDTSNLTDHVGLLNLLVSTIPCLEKGRHSSLFIESLLHKPDRGAQVETFSKLLLADQTAMFVFLGVAPVAYLTGVSTQSTAMDSMSAALDYTNPKDGQLQRRSEWKSSGLRDPRSPCVRMSAQAVAKFLFLIYLEMFTVEGLGVFQDLNISKISRLAVIHYTRSSFSELVLFLSSKITVDWRLAIDLLMDQIIADRSLLVGISNLQDFYVQFHRRGLYTTSSLASTPREMSRDMPSIRASGSGILAQPSISPIVCVNLIIPREALDALTTLDCNILGTPALRAEIAGNGWKNLFSTIQMSFGRVVTHDTTSIDFKEDLLGWNGRASMVVSFLAPAWMLLLDSEDSIKISLDIQSTPATIGLTPRFGMELKIFEATIGDQDHVIITGQLPGITTPLSSRVVMAEKAELKQVINGVLILGPDILLQNDYRAIDVMVFRLEVQEESLKTKLAVKTTVVEPSQKDPCSILITFGEWAELLVFPFPINVEKSRVRISRKLSYIEVLVPPWVPSHNGCYTSTPFGAILSDNSPLLFNMPKVPLDRLPKLEPTKKMGWLAMHAAMTLSAQERRIRHPTKMSSGGLLNVKENLHTLFSTMSESSSASGEIFGLYHAQKGIYTLIFISTVRLDLSAHTVVADAHILPLSQSVVRQIKRFLMDHQKEIRNLLVFDEGMKMWGDLLAVSVERCREGIWQHQNMICEYKKAGRIPASAAPGKPPLCSCGRGKASPDFASCKAYKHLIPFVHRAAIAHIFAVPFHEQLFVGV